MKQHTLIFLTDFGNGFPLLKTENQVETSITHWNTLMLSK